MLGWIAYRAATYAFVPACTWVGATIGTHVGRDLFRRAWGAGVNKLRGLVTVTLRRSRTYIVHLGEVVEVDPRKKYIIARGEIVVMDVCDDLVELGNVNSVNNVNSVDGINSVNSVNSVNNYQRPSAQMGGVRVTNLSGTEPEAGWEVI